MKNCSCNINSDCRNCNICGSSFNPEDIDFKRPQNHLFYIDKVYSRNRGDACPIMFNVATNAQTYRTQLFLSPLHDDIAGVSENLCEEIFGCGCECCSPLTLNGGSGCRCRNGVMGTQNGDCDCGCRNHNNGCCNNCCQLEANASFNIINSFVRVFSFTPTNPCGINASQVTLNGIAVDDLDCQGGFYEAVLSESLNNILKQTCSARDLPTKAFFLITGAGPWSYFAEFVVEGTVSTGGRNCCFRAVFTPVIGAEPTPIPNTTSNLSVPHVSIPCGSGNARPRLFFSFDGTINLLNPRLRTVNTNGSIQLILESSAVAEPSVSVEVVKKTLICLNAREAIQPCDGNDDCEEHRHCCGECDRDRDCDRDRCEREESGSGNCVCERIAESLERSGCGNSLAFGNGDFSRTNYGSTF